MRLTAITSTFMFSIFAIFSFSTPSAAQTLHLCVQQPLGLVVAIPQDQDCNNLPGQWIDLDIADDDWTGAGTGSMRTVDSSDRVAVGDTDPTARLHVAYDDADPSALIVEPDDGSGRRLEVTNDGDVVIGPQTGTNALLNVNAASNQDVLQARIEDTTRLVLDQNGRLGIGTDDPDSQLSLESNFPTDPLRIRQSGTTVLVVDEDGQTGVRTSQPQAALHVNAVQNEDPLRVNRWGTNEPQLLVTSGGNVGIGTDGPDARLSIESDSPTDPLRIRQGGNTVFAIDEDGQTGVRASQPQAALQVNAVQGEDPLRVNRWGTNDPQLLVTETGNVGINVDDPTDKLSVHNSGDGRTGFFRTDNPANITATVSAVTNGNGSALFANILNPNSTNATLHAIHRNAGRAGLFEGQVSVERNNHQFELRDSDNQFKTWTLTTHQGSGGFGVWEDGQGGQGRFLIESGGDVGIGTTDPRTRLHVEGNSDGTDLLVRDNQFARMRMVATDPGNDVTLTVQARGSNTPNRAEIGTVSNHGMVLFTNGSTRISIAADGAVCIGAC